MEVETSIVSENHLSHNRGNGAVPPDIAAHNKSEDLDSAAALAAHLLQATPSALTVTGHMTVIPVVSKPLPHEFFQTHPTLRLSLLMITPKKGSIGAHSYAVMSSALSVLAREQIEPFDATLYPIVIASRPLSYKLVMVKTPKAGRDWDAWNLSKKLALDEAVHDWRALRAAGGGYVACPPNAAHNPPDPVFPEYSDGEWLRRSLGVADLIVRDGTHPVFQEINVIR
jgi:hypothetical protein